MLVCTNLFDFKFEISTFGSCKSRSSLFIDPTCIHEYKVSLLGKQREPLMRGFVWIYVKDSVGIYLAK